MQIDQLTLPISQIYTVCHSETIFEMHLFEIVDIFKFNDKWVCFRNPRVKVPKDWFAETTCYLNAYSVVVLV